MVDVHRRSVMQCASKTMEKRSRMDNHSDMVGMIRSRLWRKIRVARFLPVLMLQRKVSFSTAGGSRRTTKPNPGVYELTDVLRHGNTVD
jgi:hypothetical protein